MELSGWRKAGQRRRQREGRECKSRALCWLAPLTLGLLLLLFGAARLGQRLAWRQVEADERVEEGNESKRDERSGWLVFEREEEFGLAAGESQGEARVQQEHQQRGRPRSKTETSEHLDLGAPSQIHWSQSGGRLGVGSSSSSSVSRRRRRSSRLESE